MYKKALQLKLRFNTPKGELTVEELFTLDKTEVDSVIRELNKELKKNDDDGLAFLDSPVTNSEDQLRFDIAKDVYLTKQAEENQRANESARKEEEQKLLGLLERKQNEALENLSAEEIQARLDALRSK